MKNNQFLSSLKAMHIFDPLEDLTLDRDMSVLGTPVLNAVLELFECYMFWEMENSW